MKFEMEAFSDRGNHLIPDYRLPERRPIQRENDKEVEVSS